MRLMVLGNRRISWEILKLLLLGEFRDSFSVPVVVTDQLIAKRIDSMSGSDSVHYISNHDRRVKEILSAITAYNIDALFSIQYNWILPQAVLDAVGGQAFNLHNAKLPDYKGYNSISHAIINGDANYESTIHWMAEQVDSGDIAYTESTPIQPNDTALSLYLRTIPAAVCAAQRLLTDLRAGLPPPRRKMDPGEGTFYKRHSIDAFANITATTDPEVVAKVARAAFFPPCNMAYRLIDGKKFWIAPAEDHLRWYGAGRVPNEPHDS